MSDEDRIRSLLRGCPIEREMLSALCYVRAAHPEALQKWSAMASPAAAVTVYTYIDLSLSKLPKSL